LKTKNHLLHLILAGIVLFAIVLVGCEGKQGPAGPAGPQGPAGPGDTTTVAYLGNNATNCGHCHGNTVSQWQTTGHSTNAWLALVTANEDTVKYCIQCHTTGFDDRYNFGGTLISHGLNQDGYDDRPRSELTGVQCEACHGPMGPNQAQHVPEMTDVLNSATCSQCHEQPEEYNESGHATAVSRAGGQAAFVAEFGSTTCQVCHISEGFIQAKDAADHPAGSMTMTNPVTCITCHDPHNKTNDMQLRTVAAATSPFTMANADSGSYQITGLGNAQLCAQCHHARRDKANVAGQVSRGSNHPGPHESPQADMYTGNGAIELGGAANIQRGPLHSTSLLADACVSCHMYTISRENPDGPVLGHSFEPDLRKCQTCHPAATNFDIGGVQTKTEQLLDSLLAFLPRDQDGSIVDTTNSSAWTPAQRAAGFTYFFVEADGSKGVHNRDYTYSILRGAIRSLQP
jgi:hypothetical protein